MATALARPDTRTWNPASPSRWGEVVVDWPNGLQISATRFLATMDLVARVRLLCPDCTVALVVNPLDDDATRKTVEAAREGIPVFMHGHHEAFRQQVTDPGRLVHSIVPHLRAQLLPKRLSLAGEHLLSEVFRLAPGHLSVDSLLTEARLPASSARTRLQKKSLPSLRAWFNLARALHGALLLQSDDALTVSEASRIMGYSDHSGLSRCFRQNLRLPVHEARAVWGWEWLMAKWLKSNTAGSISLTLKHES